MATIQEQINPNYFLARLDKNTSVSLDSQVHMNHSE